MGEQFSLENIARAIYTINRHAKTAPKPQHLYYLKNEAIKKLLAKNKAKKVGLQFSNRPKLSHQHSMLLIQVGSYYFHTIPNKKDFKNLPHLGHIDHSHHNPPVQMSLNQAKRIIYDYIDYRPKHRPKKRTHLRSYSPYYIPSSLGQNSWSKPNSRKKY